MLTWQQLQRPKIKPITSLEALGNADLLGKVAIVTGGSQGLGREVVKTLAIGGAKVYMASLDFKEGLRAKNSIDRFDSIKGSIVVLHLDLTSFKSIHEFTQAFLKSEKRLDYLVLNAGIGSPPLSYTQHGLESQFAINYVGHYVLTMDLIELMKQQGIQSRVVATASGGYAFGRLDLEDYNFKQRYYLGVLGYSQSKIALILFTKELAKRYSKHQILTCSLHPGVIVETGIIGNSTALNIKWFDRSLYIILYLLLVAFTNMMKNTTQGASTIVYGCVAEEIEKHNGAYLEDCSITKTLPFCEDMTLAEQLWERTDQIVKDIEAMK